MPWNTCMLWKFLIVFLGQKNSEWSAPEMELLSSYFTYIPSAEVGRVVESL